MIPSDDNILNSGLGQSAVRQIAFSLHELDAPAKATVLSPTDFGEKAV
jgi:hypothetical protein